MSTSFTFFYNVVYVLVIHFNFQQKTKQKENWWNRIRNSEFFFFNQWDMHLKVSSHLYTFPVILLQSWYFPPGALSEYVDPTEAALRWQRHYWTVMWVIKHSRHWPDASDRSGAEVPLMDTFVLQRNHKQSHHYSFWDAVKSTCVLWSHKTDWQSIKHEDWTMWMSCEMFRRQS